VKCRGSEGHSPPRAVSAAIIIKEYINIIYILFRSLPVEFGGIGGSEMGAERPMKGHKRKEEKEEEEERPRTLQME